MTWIDYNPTGALQGVNILEDVRSRCDAFGAASIFKYAMYPSPVTGLLPTTVEAARYGLKNGYDDDKVTCCHESTHQVHARIRNEVRKQAFYVGGGRAAIFDSPDLKLGDVAEQVPDDLRNSAFQLYLVQQRRYWDDTPLYVLDEAVSYANGSLCANELRLDNHGSHERAMWFCSYASALLRAIYKCDPSYKELDELEAFVMWHNSRVSEICGFNAAES